MLTLILSEKFLAAHLFPDKGFYCKTDEFPFYTTISDGKVCDGINDCPGRKIYFEMIYDDETYWACAKEG